MTGRRGQRVLRQNRQVQSLVQQDPVPMPQHHQSLVPLQMGQPLPRQSRQPQLVSPQEDEPLIGAHGGIIYRPTAMRFLPTPPLIRLSVGALPLYRSSVPMSSGPMSSGPMSSGPMSSGPMSSGPMSSGPMSSGPMSRGPMSRGPMSRGPMFRGPMSSVLVSGRRVLMSNRGRASRGGRMAGLLPLNGRGGRGIPVSNIPEHRPMDSAHSGRNAHSLARNPQSVIDAIRNEINRRISEPGMNPRDIPRMIEEEMSRIFPKPAMKRYPTRILNGTAAEGHGSGTARPRRCRGILDETFPAMEMMEDSPHWVNELLRDTRSGADDHVEELYDSIPDDVDETKLSMADRIRVKIRDKKRANKAPPRKAKEILPYQNVDEAVKFSFLN